MPKCPSSRTITSILESYLKLREKILQHIKKCGESDQFFPGYFTPNPYAESWSAFHFPLSTSETKELGFRTAPPLEKKNQNYLSIEEIPDNPQNLSKTEKEELTQKIFWDEITQKPFQIQKEDIDFCLKLEAPLPHTHYMRRIQENFSWMPFDGKLRTTTCAKSGTYLQPNWPAEYDTRILCEAEYLKIIN